MNRRNRTRERRRAPRQLLFEALENRVVLTGIPTLVDLNPTGDSDPTDFTPVGDVTYFVADDGTNGRELWVTDGTPGGTSLVHDINAGSGSSNPQQLVEFNGELFFVADDGINGEELWKTDGTVAGTMLVSDINPGTGGDPVGPLSSSPRELTVVNGRLYFAAENSASGVELWATDGTTAGTMLVRDIATGTFTNGDGTFPNSSNVQELVDVNGTLFFSADDGVNGRELWKSDGTENGTVLVEDLFIGNDTNGVANSSAPQKLTAVGNLLFFVARDANGLELWRSDGTAPNTFRLRNINAGSADAFNANSQLAAVGNLLLFTADDGINGDELWRSNGTTAGTILLKDINPGVAGNLSYYGGFTEVDGTLFFSANDGTTGRELWKSDGTQSGTVLIKDLHGGANVAGTAYSSYPYYMQSLDGILYFSAFSSITGRELWQSDGTEAGTVLVADAVAGSDGIYPNNLQRAGDTIVFSANDGTGRELWVLAPEPVATTKTARITIFVDGQQVAIPANVGVESDGSMAAVFTQDGSGEVVSDVGATVTLGDFFDTWRSNAGLAGNNPNAILSDMQLLDNLEDSTSTVQMFVNGRVSSEFGDYVLQDGDEVILVYGERPVVSLVTNFGAIVIELREDAAPGTVNNFLNYINDDDYINSIFHRSDDDFVIQGGGFTTTSTTFSSINQFSVVPTDPPIVNEPNLLNLRGTVAMAKTSDPNSATSGYFVNLSDNPGLDNPANSGGFTVFGRVLDMTTSDAIAALPIASNNPSPFGELPISVSNQLVVVEAVEGQGEVTGVKFSDDNANGARDAGEAAVAGAVIFIDANDNGLLDAGEITTTTDADGRYLLQVEPGTYIVRSLVAAGSAVTLPAAPGSYTVTVEIGRELSGRDFGEAIVPAPTGVDLLAVSDSGIADDDDLTRLNNAGAPALLFNVAGVTPGAEVKVYSNGLQIGTAIAGGTTATVVSDLANALSDGPHSITATQTIAGVESPASPALTIEIDSTAPAPLVSTPPDTARAEQLYTFDADSPDEGQTGIVYSLSGAPAGMTIDSATGEISWTPTVAQAVPQTFAIEVSDAAGNVTSQTVDLTVLGIIPALADAYTVAEDSTLTVDAANGVLANDGDAASGPLTASVVDLPTGGSLTLAPDGSFVYVPNGNFFGVDRFTYLATDGVGESNVATATINVSGENDPPAPQADSYTATEDTPLTVAAAQGVLANDIDVDGDVLTATIADLPTGGTVSLAADGSFVYTPNAEFSGNDSFTYTVDDGTVTSDPVTVDITVTEVFDPPIANVDAYSVDEDGTLTIDAAAGVLANDTDPDTPALTAVISSLPANGTLVLNDDGSFEYTPNADFFGEDSFTYLANDGVSNSNVTAVTIDVIAEDDPPAPAPDSYITAEDIILFIAAGQGVLANDIDVDGDTLTATIASLPTNGTVSLTASGAFIYTPNAEFSGTDSFTYTAGDGTFTSDPVTVEIVVTEVLDPPVAAADSYSVDEDATLTVDAAAGVLANDTDPDTSVLTASIDTQPANGTVVLNADGSFVYTPNANFFGSDSFTYTASDGNTTTQATTVSITVAGLPDPPSAVDDAATATNDQVPVAIDVLANDADPDGDQSLTITAVTQGTAGGSVAIVAGSIRFTAAAGFIGTDTFTYTIQDSTGRTDTATVTVDVVEPANNSVSGFVYVDAGGDGVRGGGESGIPGVQITLTGTDLAGATVSRTMLTGSSGFYSFDELPAGTYQLSQRQPAATSDGLESTTVPGAVVGNDVIGNIVLSGGQSFTENNFGERSILPQYVSIVWFFSSSMSTDEMLRETIARAEETTGHGTLAAAIRNGKSSVPVVANSAPAALNDTYSVVQDQVLTVAAASGVLANDIDGDGNTLTAQLASSPANGSLTLNADGSLTYTPNAGFTGNDSFRYQASDGALNSAVATVTISIAKPNSAPVAVDDSFSVDEDQVLSVAAASGVLTNDTDVDGDMLSAQQTTAPANGSLTLNTDGSLTYTPNADFSGTDTFSYTLSDGAGGFDQGEATITVNAVNDPPVANADSYSTNEDTPLAVDALFGVLGNDTDTEGDVLSAILDDAPDHGVLLLNADGSFSYEPEADFHGTDAFRYIASDGADVSAIAEVSITVAPVDDPPVIVLPAEFTNPVVVASRILGQTIDFTATVQDPDDDGYVFQLSLESSGIPAGQAVPTIDSETGEFQWTPTTTGRFEIRLIVVNDDGKIGQKAFLIDILPA